MSTPSPCIGICIMDASGYCQGCYRTLDEIAEWTLYDDQEAGEIIEKCTERKEETGTVGDS